MPEDSFAATTSIADLTPAQRHDLASRCANEAIPISFAGDILRFDAAYDARVESLVAAVRAGPSPPVAPTITGAPTPTPYAAPGPVPPGPYGYGVPAGYYAPAPQQNTNATLSLVFAVLSFAVCPIVLAIFGIVFGKKAEAEIAASGGTQTGEGLAKAGIIVSWVNIGLWGLMVVGYLVVILAVVVIGAAAS